MSGGDRLEISRHPLRAQTRPTMSLICRPRAPCRHAQRADYLDVFLSRDIVGSDATWPNSPGSARDLRDVSPSSRCRSRPTSPGPATLSRGCGSPVATSTTATPRTIPGPDRPCGRSLPTARHPLRSGVHVQQGARPPGDFCIGKVLLFVVSLDLEDPYSRRREHLPRDPLGHGPIKYEVGGLA